MAKSKSKSGGGGILLIIIMLVILIIGFAIISVPIISISGAIIYSFIYLSKRTKVTGSLSDFWLTESEKEKFKKVATTLLTAIETINSTNKTGDSEGISRNVDGSFSQRGNRGKELKSIIDTNQSTVYQYNESFQFLTTLPQIRWKKFRKAYSRFYGFLFAFIAWITSSMAMINKNFTEFKEGIKLIANAPKDIFKINGMILGSETSVDPNLVIQWKILIFSALVCLGTYIITILITRLLIKKISPLPPEVTLENFNSH